MAGVWTEVDEVRETLRDIVRGLQRGLDVSCYLPQAKRALGETEDGTMGDCTHEKVSADAEGVMECSGCGSTYGSPEALAAARLFTETERARTVVVVEENEWETTLGEVVDANADPLNEQVFAAMRSLLDGEDTATVFGHCAMPTVYYLKDEGSPLPVVEEQA
jgi:hypothetical protein